MPELPDLKIRVQTFFGLNMFWNDTLKGLKDGMLGLMPAALALLFPEMGHQAQVGMFVASAACMILAVTTNTVQKDFGPLDTWGKVLKDTILGACAAYTLIIQQASQESRDWKVIALTCVVTTFSVFANVVSKDVTPNTALSKMTKDFIILGCGTVVPIFTQAIQDKVALGAALSSAVVALLSVATNVLRNDWMTTGSLVPTAPTGSLKPPTAPTPMTSMRPAPVVAKPGPGIPVTAQPVPGPRPGFTSQKLRGARSPEMKKTLALLFVLFSLSTLAHAWNMPGKPLADHKLSLSASPMGEDSLVLAPTAGLGLGFGTNVPNYGANFAYDIFFARLTQKDQNNVQLSPYFGVGVALYLDMAPWLNSSFSQNITGSVGFNVVGPELDLFGSSESSMVPAVLVTYNLDTGVKTVTGNITMPLIILPDATIHKL